MRQHELFAENKNKAQWIWIDPVQYPDVQFSEQYNTWPKTMKDCVADFRKTICFNKPLKQVTLYVSGDAVFRLWVNGAFVGQGPASAGGDFLMGDGLPWTYANKYVLNPQTDELSFYAEVRLQPQQMTDITGGHGDFYLCGMAEFADGSSEWFGTDETWEARLDGRFVQPYVYDAAVEPDAWQQAVCVSDRRELKLAPIPPLCYETVLPDSENQKICLKPGESISIEFDKIYSAHIALRADRPCHVKVTCYETASLRVLNEEITLIDTHEYRSLYMKSIGTMEISVLDADGEVCLEPYLYFSHYPITAEGHMITSDKDLDLLYDVCKWTLKICRQTLHLDSPKHQEFLACSGDYFIETMMTAFTYGDMKLAALDVRRTAQWLEFNKGRMFHTTYSLIWVQWLEFVFQHTGETELLEDCHEALNSLFECFLKYVGERGVIENPPDYMFVDWVVLEGYSMHHPPKCLGQTVLNAFYYKALTDAAVIARRMGWKEAALWQERADALHDRFHPCFYDEEQKMYIDGLSDPRGDSDWQPANPPLKHFSRYANTLAALYGLCPPEEAARLVRLAADEQSGLPPVQPYFMHFVLQAVCKAGLTEEFGLTLFEKWKPLVLSCSKGLQEGWLAPEPTYSFDHSHAWGGTPAYHMPYMLTGFKMLEPGFKKISLSPQLFGLEYADVSFPTPYGMVRCVQKQGEMPEITVPEGLNWEFM